jgi:hypothetical protein
MKIGIYGDSFGCLNLNLNDPNQISWPKLLVEAGYEVVNHSLVGASFSHTFRTFSEFHSLYDVNIVLITIPGRLELKEVPNKNFFTCKEDVIFYRKRQLSKFEESVRLKTSRILDYIETHFDYALGLENDSFARKVFTAHARQLPGQNIFIGCFDDIIPESLPLYDIYNFENIALGYDNAFPNRGPSLSKVINGKYLIDLRVCHLTEENHSMVAEKILSAIDCKSQTIDLKISEFKKPSKDIMHYFRLLNI